MGSLGRKAPHPSLLTDSLLQFVTFYADLALGQAFFFLQRTQPAQISHNSKQWPTCDKKGARAQKLRNTRGTQQSHTQTAAHTHGWVEAQDSVQMHEAEMCVQCPQKEGCESYYCQKSPLAQKPKEKSLCGLCCTQMAERNHVLILTEDLAVLRDPETLSAVSQRIS